MYKTIEDLPIDYDFSNKSNKQLKLYEKWFNNNKQYRINNLTEYVHSSVDFQDWKSDFSISSLKDLDSWFKKNIETQEISENDYKKLREETPDWINLDKKELTIKTKSIIVDVGIYLGEVFSRNNNINWTQYLSGKDNNKGHMVLKLKSINFNPIWVTYILSTKIAFSDNRYSTPIKEKDSLCGIYDTYMSYNR